MIQPLFVKVLLLTLIIGFLVKSNVGGDEKPQAKETTFKGNNDNGKLWFTTLLENQTVLESATLKLSVTVAEKNEITENLQVKWYRRGKMLEFLYKIEQKS